MTGCNRYVFCKRIGDLLPGKIFLLQLVQPFEKGIVKRNNMTETKRYAENVRRHFFIQALTWSFVVFVLLCWGLWQELQINSVTSMTGVIIHSWRWVISLGIVWLLALYLLGRSNRSLADSGEFFRQMSLDLVGSEQELFRQKALSEAIVNTMSDAVVLADDRNRIVMTNPAFTELTGYTSEEVMGRWALFLFTDPGTFLSNRVEHNPEVYEMECRMKDESVIPTEIRYTSVRNPGGTINGYLMVLRDLTLCKAAEKEYAKLKSKLSRSSKMETIGTLAGGIAHDFNNILGIVFMNTDLALEDIPEGNPARTNIDRIVQASTRGRNLVKQILVYSRQEDQKLVPLMPGSFIKESLQFLDSTTPASVMVVRHINDGFRRIMMDPAQMRELLLNLFSSAVQAMDDKGTIEVTGMVVELDESDVASQQDMQPGPYFRLSVSGKGLGIDLAPVMGIVHNHEGYVTVDSESGSGTAVQVFFPVVEQEEGPAESGEVLRGVERILFVDDEHMLIEMAGMFLEQQGFRVTKKTDSREALEIFRSMPDEYDIVVTDQTMPKMTGSELAVELFKIRPDIPVILLSGYSEKISVNEVKKLGVREFLAKPFDGKTLARSIRKVLDEKTFP